MADDRPDSAKLQKRWLHSHEEDTPGRTVYRPADYPFPPSRGRKGFELDRDGKLVEIGVGPTDRSTQTQGRWRLIGDKTLEFTKTSMAAAAAPSEPRQFHIEECDGKRLVLSKDPPTCPTPKSS
jgi:hypothetical protein